MRDKIKLVSTGLTKAGKPTGTFYTTNKNKKTTTGKLEFSKYDKLAFNEATGKNGKHVIFKEAKI